MSTPKKKPAAKKGSASTRKPAAKKPAAKKPAAKKPAAKKPAAKKPAAKKPAAKKPVAKKGSAAKRSAPKRARVVERSAEALGGFRAAELGAALAEFAASSAAATIAKNAHFLDTGRVIDDFARGGCFLLAEAFGRWAGPATEMLAVWHFDEHGAYPEMGHVVARIGDAFFDASGARTAEQFMADRTAVWGDGYWLGPFSWQDAEGDGISCEAGPLTRLRTALSKALGRPENWGLSDAFVTDNRWTRVRVVARGGRADVLALLPGAGVPEQSVSVSGEGVEFDVRKGAASELLRALRALPDAAPVFAQPRETHAPGGKLPTRYRPRGDDGEQDGDDGDDG